MKNLCTEADAAGRAVLLEDTAVDDTLIDAVLLDAVVHNVAAAVNGLLEHAKVELALTANVVAQRGCHRLERRRARGEEYLRRVVVEVERDGKVAKDTGSEGCAEQNLGRVGVDVAKQLQSAGVDGAVAADQRAGLEHQLVGAEISALEEDELVLVGQVEGALGVRHEREVQGLDADSRVVGARVAGGQELGAAEASLDVVCAGGEDGLVADGDLDGHSVLVEQRAGDGGQLEKRAQSKVLAKHIAGVVDVVVGVKRSQAEVGGDAAIELKGALLGSSQDRQSQEREVLRNHLEVVKNVKVKRVK